MKRLKALVPYIARYEKEIAQLFELHPDSALFNNLPGAGPILGPRLLVAFGTDRERFHSPLDAVTFFGVAPVTEQSGKSRWIHFRWACPKFLRQSSHEFAGQSIRFCDWAAVYYQQQRARGKDHHAAVRALAYGGQVGQYPKPQEDVAVWLLRIKHFEQLPRLEIIDHPSLKLHEGLPQAH